MNKTDKHHNENLENKNTNFVHETDRVVASASRVRRTWSPARRDSWKILNVFSKFTKKKATARRLIFKARTKGHWPRHPLNKSEETLLRLLAWSFDNELYLQKAVAVAVLGPFFILTCVQNIDSLIELFVGSGSVSLIIWPFPFRNPFRKGEPASAKDATTPKKRPFWDPSQDKALHELTTRFIKMFGLSEKTHLNWFLHFKKKFMEPEDRAPFSAACQKILDFIKSNKPMSVWNPTGTTREEVLNQIKNVGAYVEIEAVLKKTLESYPACGSNSKAALYYDLLYQYSLEHCIFMAPWFKVRYGWQIFVESFWAFVSTLTVWGVLFALVKLILGLAVCLFSWIYYTSSSYRGRR